MYHSSLFLAHSLLTVPVAFTSASVMSSNQILVSNPISRMPTEIDAVVCRSAAKRSKLCCTHTDMYGLQGRWRPPLTLKALANLYASLLSTKPY